MGPMTVEDALSLSAAAVVPYVVLSWISMSNAFLSAPVLAAKAVIIPTSTVFVPSLGICAILIAVARGVSWSLVDFMYGFIGKYS
ncbi:hypothetical protein K438DRAFT_1822935, partial [Mycena galopus ATCC 62051]